jgi:hypothetical protein
VLASRWSKQADPLDQRAWWLGAARPVPAARAAVVAAVLVGAICGPLALLAAAAQPPAAAQSAGVAPEVPPAGVLGFAELAVAAFVNQADEEHPASLAQFYPAAGSDPGLRLDGMWAGQFYAARAVGVAAAPAGPGDWAVTVAVEVLEAVDGAYQPAGTRYYTVGVHQSLGRYAATSLPGQVPAPPPAAPPDTAPASQAPTSTTVPSTTVPSTTVPSTTVTSTTPASTTAPKRGREATAGKARGVAPSRRAGPVPVKVRVPGAAAPYAGGATRCVKPDPTGGRCLTGATLYGYRQVKARFPRWSSVGCQSNRDGRGDHPLGRACDFAPGVLGRRPNAAQLRQGWALAAWLRANARALKVGYIIWQHRIWSVADPRDRGGWGHDYTHGLHGTEGPTLGHYDHVHVSFLD